MGSYGEGPIAEEGGEVLELEGEARGEHNEAERGGVRPRRHVDKPPERLGPRDGDRRAGRDVGRVQTGRRGQRRVPPRRGRGRGGPLLRAALDSEGGGEAMALGEGEMKAQPWHWPGRGPRGREGAEGEEEKTRSHGEGGVRSRVAWPQRRGGWFCLSGARARRGVKCGADFYGGYSMKAGFRIYVFAAWRLVSFHAICCSLEKKYEKIIYLTLRK